MSRNKKEMYKNIYRNAYNANINNTISESKYIDILQSLSMKGFKTYHVENFNIFTKNLQLQGLYDSFNISVLINMRDLTYKHICSIALMFEDIGNIFAVKKKNMINRINSIRKLLKNKLKCITAFKRVDIVTSIRNSDVHNSLLDTTYTANTFNNIYNNNDSIDSQTIQTPLPKRLESDWEYYVKKDIIERLHLIVQVHYTLEQLKFMNIKLMLISDINNMTHNELRKYYVYVIDKIEKSIKFWMDTCRNYIDIEINYVECCENMINNLPTQLTIKLDKIHIF